MTITMQNLERLTLAEMQEFLAGSRSIGFRVQGREQIYRFVERVLAAQHYRRLGRRQKGIVRRFLARLSGLSRAQLTRLIGQWLRHRRIEANEVRLQLSVPAYNLGNLWRRLGLPNRIKSWSLTSLQHRLMKTGGRLVKHARYYWLLLAEGHLNRRLFGDMLHRIWALPLPSG